MVLANVGLSAGISSTIAGGDFWQGMRQGLITTGLNDLAHWVADGKKDPPGEKEKVYDGGTLEEICVGGGCNNTNELSGKLNFWDKVNSGIGAFDVGQGAKAELFALASRSNSSINNLNYIKFFKSFGYATFGTSSLISGNHDGMIGDIGPKKVGKFGETYKTGLVDEQGTKHRMGVLYLGYQSYRVGANSEWIRHFFQNQMIHGSFIAKQRMFEMTDNKFSPYAQYQTRNTYTTW